MCSTCNTGLENVYVNTAKQVGDKDHIKVFATVEAAEIWFEENDPEGVAFEYDVIRMSATSPRGALPHAKRCFTQPPN